MIKHSDGDQTVKNTEQLELRISNNLIIFSVV